MLTMGAEVIAAVLATLVGLGTWSHQQRQTVLNDRFNSIKKRLEDVEKIISEFPHVYASKTDLNYGLTEIKDRLTHINDKLDQLILSRLNEKQ
jgi:tetrahydromethanopterin S-methyltransferase subunit G